MNGAAQPDSPRDARSGRSRRVLLYGCTAARPATPHRRWARAHHAGAAGGSRRRAVPALLGLVLAAAGVACSHPAPVPPLVTEVPRPVAPDAYGQVVRAVVAVRMTPTAPHCVYVEIGGQRFRVTGGWQPPPQAAPGPVRLLVTGRWVPDAPTICDRIPGFQIQMAQPAG